MVLCSDDMCEIEMCERMMCVLCEKESYLVIYPDGSLKWCLADPDNLCPAFHRAIGCDWLENVYTVLRDIVIIVDEVGKVKQDPQPLNPIASRLYAGSLYGDFIHGPAVVAAIHLRNGESDWVPLSLPELLKVAGFLDLDLDSELEEIS